MLLGGDKPLAINFECSPPATPEQAHACDGGRVAN